MIRAVFLIINSRPDSHWISFMKSQLKHYDLRNSAEPLGPEQSPTNHLCYGIYFPDILRCYRPLKLTQLGSSFRLARVKFDLFRLWLVRLSTWHLQKTFIPPPIRQRPLASSFWIRAWKIHWKQCWNSGTSTDKTVLLVVSLGVLIFWPRLFKGWITLSTG